jgi:hypothetical protein
MGDQIDSEPVVRKIITNHYKDCDIVLASDWPRIFEHLEEHAKVCHVLDIGNTMSKDQPYYAMETLPIPESSLGMSVSHPLVHSTDYSSLSCLRTILPSNEKQIRLRTTIKDVEGLSEKISIDSISTIGKSIAIHAGRGWPSKTFPASWWQEVIDGIARYVKVCLIGKHIGDDQGLVQVTCPENAIDLRDKTSIGELFLAISAAPVLISNDSAPIHIAGAFDNWIIALPTRKHPAHILPWRNGSQDHKTVSLYKKLVVDDICNLPTQIYGETIDWIPKRASVPFGMELDMKDAFKGGDILDYLPEPSIVISKALELFKAEKC